MAEKLLLTGASGFLGQNLVRCWGESFSLIPVSSPRRGRREGYDCCDLTDYQASKALLDAHKPDIVVHTAAARDPNFCEENPRESGRINRDATAELAGLCADRGIRFVFTSTDLVFDGREAPYAETDGVNPLGAYGEQKVEAEVLVGERWPEAVICRLPLLFGATGPETSNFGAGFLAKARLGKVGRLFVDEFRTPLSARDVAAGIVCLVRSSHTGVVHLAGGERVSRFEFGKAICEAFLIQPAPILETKQADVPMAAPRPADVSLQIERARQLGFEPRPLAEAVLDMEERWS